MLHCRAVPVAHAGHGSAALVPSVAISLGLPGRPHVLKRV